MSAGTSPVAGSPVVSDEGSPRRRGPRRWAAAVVAAAMVATLLAATAAGFRFVQSDSLPAPARGPVIAVSAGDGAWPAAQVTGTLRLQDGCLLVDDAVALFPAGTTWSAPDQVVLADGTRWSVGDRIEGGGGLLEAATITDTDLGGDATSAAAACATALGVADVVMVRP